MVENGRKRLQTVANGRKRLQTSTKGRKRYLACLTTLHFKQYRFFKRNLSVQYYYHATPGEPWVLLGLHGKSTEPLFFKV